MPKKKRTRAVNKKLEDLSRLLVDCTSWPEFNIKLVLNGYELDNDALIVIIHFAFADSMNWSSWFSSDDAIKRTEAIRSNCKQILVEACEDEETAFTDDMIDLVMKKTIF